MPFQAICHCGATHTFDDHFAGQLTKCPTCRATMVARPPRDAAPRSASPTAPPRAVDRDPFDRDRFLFRQKLFTLHEQYAIVDEDGQPLISAKRPARWAERAKANAIAGFVFTVIFFAVGSLATYFHDGRPRSNTLFGVIVMFGAVVGAIASTLVYVQFMPLRSTFLYAGSTDSRFILEIPQLTRFALFRVRYSLRDPNRKVLALIERNYLRSLLRGYWVVHTPDRRRVLCIVQEDSMLLAIVRRLLTGWLRYVGVPWVGPLTNFTIRSGTGERLGIFNRKITLLDRYVLDLSDDPQCSLDRRIAVAVGIMLDTGEGR